MKRQSTQKSSKQKILNVNRSTTLPNLYQKAKKTKNLDMVSMNRINSPKWTHNKLSASPTHRKQKRLIDKNLRTLDSVISNDGSIKKKGYSPEIQKGKNLVVVNGLKKLKKRFNKKSSSRLPKNRPQSGISDQNNSCGTGRTQNSHSLESERQKARSKNQGRDPGEGVYKLNRYIKLSDKFLDAGRRGVNQQSTKPKKSKRRKISPIQSFNRGEKDPSTKISTIGRGPKNADQRGHNSQKSSDRQLDRESHSADVVPSLKIALAQIKQEGSYVSSRTADQDEEFNQPKITSRSCGETGNSQKSTGRQKRSREKAQNKNKKKKKKPIENLFNKLIKSNFNSKGSSSSIKQHQKGAIGRGDKLRKISSKNNLRVSEKALQQANEGSIDSLKRQKGGSKAMTKLAGGHNKRGANFSKIKLGHISLGSFRPLKKTNNRTNSHSPTLFQSTNKRSGKNQGQAQLLSTSRSGADSRENLENKKNQFSPIINSFKTNTITGREPQEEEVKTSKKSSRLTRDSKKKTDSLKLMIEKIGQKRQKPSKLTQNNSMKGQDQVNKFKERASLPPRTLNEYNSQESIQLTSDDLSQSNKLHIVDSNGLEEQTSRRMMRSSPEKADLFKETKKPKTTPIKNSKRKTASPGSNLANKGSGISGFNERPFSGKEIKNFEPATSPLTYSVKPLRQQGAKNKSKSPSTKRKGRNVVVQQQSSRLRGSHQDFRNLSYSSKTQNTERGGATRKKVNKFKERNQNLSKIIEKQKSEITELKEQIRKFETFKQYYPQTSETIIIEEDYDSSPSFLKKSSPSILSNKSRSNDLSNSQFLKTVMVSDQAMENQSGSANNQGLWLSNSTLEEKSDILANNHPEKVQSDLFGGNSRLSLRTFDAKLFKSEEKRRTGGGSQASVSVRKSYQLPESNNSKQLNTPPPKQINKRSERGGPNFKHFLCNVRGSDFIGSLLFSENSQKEIFSQFDILNNFLVSNDTIPGEIIQSILFTIESVKSKVSMYKDQVYKLYLYQQEIIQDLQKQVQELTSQVETESREHKIAEESLNLKIFDLMKQTKLLNSEKLELKNELAAALRRSQSGPRQALQTIGIVENLFEGRIRDEGSMTDQDVYYKDSRNRSGQIGKAKDYKSVSKQENAGKGGLESNGVSGICLDSRVTLSAEGIDNLVFSTKSNKGTAHSSVSNNSQGVERNPEQISAYLREQIESSRDLENHGYMEISRPAVDEDGEGGGAGSCSSDEDYRLEGQQFSRNYQYRDDIQIEDGYLDRSEDDLSQFAPEEEEEEKTIKKQTYENSNDGSRSSIILDDCEDYKERENCPANSTIAENTKQRMRHLIESGPPLGAISSSNKEHSRTSTTSNYEIDCQLFCDSFNLDAKVKKDLEGHSKGSQSESQEKPFDFKAGIKLLRMSAKNSSQVNASDHSIENLETESRNSRGAPLTERERRKKSEGRYASMAAKRLSYQASSDIFRSKTSRDD